MTQWFQRFILNDGDDLEYDYMGHAEFEFGVTTKAREALARTWVDNKISARRYLLAVRFGKSEESFKAILIGDKATLDALPDSPILNTYADKARLRSENKNIVGWMIVGSKTPVVIFRDDENLNTNFERLERYLKVYVTKFEKEANNAVAERDS